MTETYAPFAKRLIEINAEIGALQEEKDAITALILHDLTPGTRIEADGLTITVGKPVERLNTRKLTEAYPLLDFPHLYKAVVDTTAVRKHVPPADLEKHGVFDVQNPRVSVK